MNQPFPVSPDYGDPQPNFRIHAARQLVQAIMRPDRSVVGELARRRSQLLAAMSFIVFLIGAALVVNQLISFPHRS